VNVIEARQHLLVDRHRIAGGLDDEDDAFFIDRQRIAAGSVGFDDVAAVGNQDAGDTRIARRAPRAAGAVLINAPEIVLAAAAMTDPAATAIAAAVPYFTTSRREGSELPPPNPSSNVFMAASPLPIVAFVRPFAE
jgi:hypothetical protein